MSDNMRKNNLIIMRLLLCNIILGFGCILLFVPHVLGETGQQGYIPGRFIVTVKSLNRLPAMRAGLGQSSQLNQLFPVSIKQAESSENIFDRVFIYATSDSTATVDDITQELGVDNVDRIEQDQYLDLYSIPTDPLFNQQWYLLNSGQSYWGIEHIEGNYNDTVAQKTGLAGVDIGISGLYATPPQDVTEVVVAIVDTGIDPTHPDLMGRLWNNEDEIPGNGIDDDHNGFIDDTIGYDLSGDIPSYYNFQSDNDPTDHHGHGTHLAGLITARLDDQGMAGITSNAKIMVIKTNPNAFLSVGTAGILYAINNGAKVINISWGTNFDAVILKDALDLARRCGIFVSIAAGNTGNNYRARPAGFDSSFAVAAGNSDGKLASFSSWGEFVDIVAPGQDILSLRASGTDMYAASYEPGVHIVGPNDQYFIADGTSMAAPIVAGAAALLWAIRPDLRLSQLETILRMGATDILDPLNRGDSLVGPDTICGYGYLNIGRSLELLINGGIAIIEPKQLVRTAGVVPIKAVKLSGYTGSWLLEYSTGEFSENWQFLASGDAIGSDSVIFNLNIPEYSGLVNLRITDDFGETNIVTFKIINENRIHISSPQAGETHQSNIPIRGSVCGELYDSLSISFRFNSDTTQHLISLTAEFFDTLIYNWNASGLKSGNCKLYLTGYFTDSIRVDSVSFILSSSFSTGWPQALTARGSQTVVSGDLNHDGVNEIIAATFNGLYVFNSAGQVLPGFPKFTTKDMRCIPALYDVDSDGNDEIICTSDDGIHVFKYDGSYASGWPILFPLSRLVFGYPTPSVVNVIPNQKPVIFIINNDGKIYAYRLNGDSYFYSLGGYFASVNNSASQLYFYSGNSVTAADVNGDAKIEVVVSFSGLSTQCGVAVFDGRSGLPASGNTTSRILDCQTMYGMTLADLTGDNIPEIIATGTDSVNVRTLWIKTKTFDGKGFEDLDGFPIKLPGAMGWLGNYPITADLDYDNNQEIILSFSGYDIGSLYVFRSDGTSYRDSLPGSPRGEAFRYPNTLGVPVTADLVGDDHPEIIFRGGYILPGTGSEVIFALDYTCSLIQGYPIITPAKPNVVYSNGFAPLVDDIDHDGLIELAYLGDASQIYVWDYSIPSNQGKNYGRHLVDNRNRNIRNYTDPQTDIDDDPDQTIPSAFSLFQNYPNPFNPTTIIPFSLPKKGHVVLEVFNILGQRISVLIDTDMSSGEYSIPFDGNNLASGVYLYRLTTEGTQQVRKMVLMR